VKLRHRPGKNRIKTSLGFKPPKGALDSAVVDLWSTRFIFFDGQFFPLTSEVQQFQNIVKERVQRELRLRTTTAKVEVGQDKFLELLQGQIRGNPLPGFRFSHDYSNSRPAKKTGVTLA